MSLKSLKSRFNHSASKPKTLGLLSVGMLLVVGNGSALAAEKTNSFFSTQSNTSTQLLSQNRSRDIIIEDEPSTGTRTGSDTRTANEMDPRFGCEVNSGQYTVMYYPDGVQTNKQPWAVPGQLGGGWDPKSRCETISARLEDYRQYGLLELKTGRENNMDTVCATTEAKPGCLIVLTVPPNQDAIDVRNRIFDNLLMADSGYATTGVNTFNGGMGGKLGQIINNRSRSTGINLQQFLTPNDRKATTNRQTQQPGNRNLGIPKIFQR